VIDDTFCFGFPDVRKTYFFTVLVGSHRHPDRSFSFMKMNGHVEPAVLAGEHRTVDHL
jgi:hypothetical protein